MLTEAEACARDDMLAYIERLEKRSAEMEGAMRNCLLLAMKRLHKGSHEIPDWETIIRFCKEGGVAPSPLRDNFPK
jgi:hypothetical protein